MKNLNKNQKGYVISIITFFILIIMLAVALSMSTLTFYGQKISANVVKSTQSYYAAESGVEDALVRLKSSPQMSSTSYSLTVNGATANVTIPVVVGSSRAISSQGNNNNVIRNIQAVYSVDSQGVAFHYGAQVGDGGLTMNSNSQIKGNVYSNGNVSGGANTVIDNNVIVAGNGHSVSGVHVKGNVLAYSCSNSTIDGNLTYVTGGTNTCTVHGTTSTQSGEISPQPLPITQEQIDNWKSEATDGGVTTGNVSIGNNQTVTMGPVKITGNLTIGSNATINMTGTVYVQGTVSVGNNATVKLDNSYGSLGGVFLSDGIITLNSNAVLKGSGQSGSYLLIISTSVSGTAIGIGNNATGAVFYTSAGGITINNNASIKEVTAYKLSLGNNAIVTYDSGLENILFTDGPSGGWKITGWGEN